MSWVIQRIKKEPPATGEGRARDLVAPVSYYARNKDLIKMQQKQYRLENKEATKEVRKLYRLNHKEAIKESRRKYRLNNKEAIKEAQRQYCLKNKQLMKEMYKKYYLNHKEAILENRKKNRRNKKRSRSATKPLRDRKNRIWTNPLHVRAFFERASLQLFIREPVDWYRISRNQIVQIGGSRLYSVFGNLGKGLQYAFPELHWDLFKFSLRGKKSRQRWLKVMLERLLPQNTIVVEDYLHPLLFWDERQSTRMELDIWVPEYKIALEYQGEHHYHDLFAYGPSGTHSLAYYRDEKKKEACSENGISLITIPYWWDGKIDSLASTLSHVRPDLFLKTPFPQIPNAPPNLSITGDSKLKGNNTISSFLMQGQVWNNEDPTGWIISEKLDGFRAYWDGYNLFSKNGGILPVPDWFTDTFPRDVCLDGELWAGYGGYHKLYSILRKTTCNPHNSMQLWNDIKFCVFDAPMHPGNYFERHAFASQSARDPNICVIPIIHCLGFEHLKTILHQITNKKGEGVMLYHPTANYTSGRTNNVLKVKTYEEEDVKFVKINPNCYSFICEQSNSVECIVKCSGWDYSFPPPPGTVITVKHNGFFKSSQKLKYPFLLKLNTQHNNITN